MFQGRSLVNQQLIRATDIDAGVCAELQIVCPACLSPVYKSGSEYTKMQYLAHYAGGYPDCELRVRRIVQTELARPLVVTTVPSDTDLQAFLQQYENILLELNGGIALRLERMRSRPSYRSALRDFQNHVRNYADHFDSAFDIILSISYSEDQQPSLSPREQEACRYVMRYVMAPNTFRIFMFSVNYAAVSHPNALQPWVAEFMIEASDRKFQRWWAATLPQPELLNKVVAEMHMMLCGTIIGFVIHLSK